MSLRNKPYRDKDKDKRSLRLEKESEKLRREISELEDALILHSRFENERDKSVRGLIRKEIGGSHWEHGGEGKLRTYRSQKDLDEGHTGRKLNEIQQGKKSNRPLHPKKQNDQVTANTSKSARQKNASSMTKTGLASLKSEKSTKEKYSDTDLEISCINADWNLSQAKLGSTKVMDAPAIEESSIKMKMQEDNSISNLKSKVLAKATAKILSKSNSSRSHFHDTQYTPQDSKVSDNSSRSDGNLNARDDTVKMVSRMSIEKPDLEVEMIEKRSSDQHKSCYQYKPMSTDVDISSFQGFEQNASSKLSERDESSKLNSTFEKSFNDSFRSVRPIKEYSNNRTVPHNGHDFSQSSPKDSSLIRSQFGDITYSGQALSLQSTDIKSREAREDIKQDKKDVKTSDDKCPPLEEEVLLWLENLDLHSMEHYVNLFTQHQMDMASIRLLTTTQLREMGIHALGPIMKIMKGVQILGRRNSTDDVSNDATYDHKHEQQKSTEDPQTSHFLPVETSSSGFAQGLNKNKVFDLSHHLDSENGQLTALNRDKKCKKSNKEKNVKPGRPVSFNTGLHEKKAHHSTEMEWKKTSDTAEFLNLNDRSPITDLDKPLIMTVKEKESQSKTTTSTTKKKSDQMRKLSSKFSRKPPQITSNVKITDDGVSSAAQKNMEKQRQQQKKVQSEGRVSARRKEMRDEMAERHHVRRRSASLDRDGDTSARRHSLQRSSSFAIRDKERTVEKGLSMKSDTESLDHFGNSDDVKENFKAKKEARKKDHSRNEMNMDEIAAVLRDFPDDSSKSQDDSQLITLGAVRELKKQLNDLEQHLVQTQDNPYTVNEISSQDKNDVMLNRDTSKEDIHSMNVSGLQMIGTENDSSRDHISGRKSTRKRRREKLGIQTGENNENKLNDAYSVISEPKICGMSVEIYQASSVRRSDHGLNSDEQAGISAFPNKGASDARIHETTQSSHQQMVSTDDSLRVISKHPYTASKHFRGSRINQSQNIGFEDRLHRIEIDRQDISFEKKDMLGEGVFSQVFKGTYQGSQVAVKQLRAPLLAADKNYFSAEVSLLQELRHPHVVMLLGVCTSSQKPVMVLELMEGGKLSARLHNYSLPPLSKSEVYQISRDVASGVSYLHHHRPPVLHLDLKSRNVLLGFGNRAKVADFGFSKLKHEADIKISRASKPRALSGSPAWMAPELLAAGEITAKADVYSFAIVMWEMLSRRHPYEGFSMFQILEHVRLNRRPELPSGYPPKLINLVIKCWEQNPAARLGFKDILKSLDDVFMVSEQIPWPDETVKEIVEEKSHARVENEKKVGRKDVNQTQIIQKEKGEDDFQTDNMDVRSVSSDDVELLECENKDIAEKPRNEFTQENQSNVNEKDIQNRLPGMIGEDNDFERRNSEGEVKEPSKVTPGANGASNSSLPSTDLISGLPITSPRLVSSPRLREMAKKQAVERNSAIFLSHSLDQTTNIVKTERASPRSLTDYPHNDDKLESLMQKYLPSPRNRTLLQERSDNIAGRLLPLRQSIDKPRKPPMPRKPQNISMRSQSLNFDHSPAASENVVQLNLHEKHPPKRKPKPSPLVPQKSKPKDIVVDNHETTENSSFESTSKEREIQSEKLDVRDYHSLHSNSSHVKAPSPRLKSTTKSMNLTEESHSASFNLFSNSEKDEIISSSNDATKAEEHENVTHSTSDSTRENRTMKSLLCQISAHFKNDLENSTKITDDLYETKNLNDSRDSPSILKISVSDSKYSDNEKKSLPFLSELKNKPSLNKVKNQADKNDCFNSFSEGSNRSSPVTHGSKGDPHSSNDEALSRHQFNIILPVSDNSHQPQDPHELVHSDSESSICTDFSLDSLSMTLSDDNDSFNSDRMAGFDQKRSSLSEKENKVRRNNAVQTSSSKGTLQTIDHSSLPRTASQGHQLQNDSVRESFFLFDDFQLTSDAKHDTEHMKNYNRPYHAMNVPSSKAGVKTVEKPSDQSSLGIVTEEINSLFSESEENKHHQQQQQRNNNHNNKTRFQTKNRPVQYQPRKEQQKTEKLSHPPHSFEKPDDGSLAVDGRQIMSNWPIPPVSSEEPEARPLRNVQFSLEASMLIKQKSQLRSVAVQGQTPMVDMKNAGKRSMPSVASILKKAIEERRFALGDNIESQDVTPEASWSIQDEDT